jgi:hypothetical protein
MMDTLTDKNFRKELIARYLDAETDAAEEMLLAEYFAEHRPEADEEAVARLILAERPEALLSGGEQAFAREAARGRGGSAARPWRWALAGLAAAAALFLLLRPTAPPAPAFTPLEIAESLNTIMNLGLGEVESATATPSGANLIVTVHLKDGTDLPFIMSRDGDTGTLSLASTE